MISSRFKYTALITNFPFHATSYYYYSTLFFYNFGYITKKYKSDNKTVTVTMYFTIIVVTLLFLFHCIEVL